MRRAVVLAAVASLAACGRHDVKDPPAPIPSAVLEASAALPEVADAAPEPPMPWADAVRLEKWDEATRALDAMADVDKARGEIRYVRARVAIARGDAAAALPLLDGLESLLPLLRDDIEKWRAEARLVAGPFEQAGVYFGAKGDATSLLTAADAFVKANDSARARQAAERVLSLGKRSRVQEARARAIRYGLADKPGLVEITDARWLAVHAPDVAAASTAIAALPRIDAAHPLTGQEQLTRAQALADAGSIDDALRAVDDSASAPPPGATHLERMRAKGYILYKSRNRYLEAAKLLGEAAALGGPHAAEDAFHAARAMSRADKDDDAIRGYESVSQNHRKTPWGDEATYFIPYLHILHAEWREAAHGFDEYVKRYPDGIHKHDAGRYRAIAHMMNKSLKVARQLFEQMSADEADPVTAARMANMAALAALRDGDQLRAIARWTDVARTRPLTYPALVARARLESIGAAIPPMIDPPESAPALPTLTVALPPPVDMLHRVGLDTDAENALRAREQMIATASSGRSGEALCAAYAQLGVARRRYEIALEHVSNTTLATAPGPRTRWAWECAYPTPYEDHVRAMEEKDSVPRGLVYAVMRQESGFDPDVVSPAHAVGLLQLLPETAKTLAGELQLAGADARLTSPPYNITLGAHYLHELLDRFKGDAPLAVGAYNGGPEAIARWLTRASGLELDVFVERIPYKETRDYIARVIGNLARYGYLREGDAGVPKVTLAL
jgi:soluble lytic murein transglycosylase